MMTNKAFIHGNAMDTSSLVVNGETNR